MKTYVYRCTNGGCRKIEYRTGMKKIHLTCPSCGHVMILVEERKEWEKVTVGVTQYLLEIILVPTNFFIFGKKIKNKEIIVVDLVFQF